jgi:hypothetical protein
MNFCRLYSRRWLSRLRMLAWAAGVLSLPALAASGPVPASSIELFPDTEIASTGDFLGVTLRIASAGVTSLRSSYAIPSTVRYQPGSVTLDGVPLRDDDPRLDTSGDSLRIALSGVLAGTTTLAWQLRIVADIGQAVLHDAVLEMDGPKIVLHAPPTWIEDENATLYKPPLVQDGTISATESNWNFGGATTVEVRSTSERRGMLQFDIAAVLAGLPVGYEVERARLELWPTSVSGAVILNAKRLKQYWTEGTQTGAACIAGATWTSRNCVSSWPDGGDVDGGVAGFTILGPGTSFASIDITSLANDWVRGARLNQGLQLQASSATSQVVRLAAREGQSISAPAARLVIVLAPTAFYDQKACDGVKAEIVPTSVITNFPNQRFRYTQEYTFGNSNTGLQRLRIAVPSNFTFVDVDSVRANNVWLRRSTDDVLADGEFELWKTGANFDVRFLPVLVKNNDPHVDVIFRAGTPSLADLTGKDFLSWVDHDRRGYPMQLASKGDANRQPDDNTWRVITRPVSITRIDIAPADTSVALGETVPYRAWARYSDGSRTEVTNFATWNVAPAGLGSFGPQAGTLHTANQGTGNVTATFAGVPSATATLQIGPHRLVSLSIAPPGATFAAGLMALFTAQGAYTDGDTLDVTNLATWTLGDPSVATLTAPGSVRGLKAGSTSLGATLAGVPAASVSVTITPPELVSIAIAPADTSIALGFAVQLRATGTYTDSSTANLASVASWNVSPSGIVDLNVDGLATSLAAGVATVHATFGAISSAPAAIQVTPPVLVAIAVTPADTTVALGRPLQLHAQGTWSNGARTDLTNSCTWSASPPGIVTVDANGLAATLTQGVASIHAQVGSLQSPAARLAVGSAVLVNLSLSPADTSLALGQQVHYRVTGTWSNGTTSNVTSSVTWTIAPLGRVDIDSLGIATSRATGAATVVASAGIVSSNSAWLAIGPPALTAISLAPADTTVALGQSAQMRATGTWTDGTRADLTSQVAWQVFPTGIVTIDGGGHVATLAPGTAQVRAALGEVTSPTSAFRVDPPRLVSIAIAPVDTSAALGVPVPLRATGTYSNGTTASLSGVIWSAVPAGIVDIDASGRAIGRSVGSAAVRGTVGAITSPAASFTVTPATLVSIAIVPSDTTVALGLTVPLIARGTFTDGSTTTLSGVSWSATPPGIIDIAPSGVATSTSQGAATIHATVGTTSSAAATLHVAPPQLTSLATAPIDTAIALGSSLQLHATGTLTDGSMSDLTAVVAWQSAPGGIVSIDPAGLATAVTTGTATWTASYAGQTSTPHALTVLPAVLVSLDGAPNQSIVGIGSTLAVTSTGHYSDGSTSNRTNAVTWASLDPGIADFTGPGMVSALATGVARLTHQEASIAGDTLHVTVVAATIDSVRITPRNPHVPPGVDIPLVATAYFSDATTADVSQQVPWSSSAPGIASIASPGHIATYANGIAVITVDASGIVSAPCSLTVDTAAIDALLVAPADTTVVAGRQARFRAQGTSAGALFDATAACAWTTGNASLASLVSPGLVATHASGNTTVAATLGSVSSPDASLHIAAPVVTSIALAPADTVVAVGRSFPFRARATYSDGSSAEMASSATWTLLPPGIATVGSGVLSALAPGSVAVRASSGGVQSNVAAVLVTPRVLEALAILPADTTLALGTGLQLRARARWSDGAVTDVTGASWNVTPAGIVGIDASGFASTIAIGATSVRATLASVTSAPASLAVGLPELVSIAVEPADSSLALGETARLRARATWTDGHQSLLASATWMTAPAGIVSIDSIGLVTPLAVGSVAVRARRGAVESAPVPFTVGPPRLLSLDGSPDVFTIPLGWTRRVTSIGSFSDGSNQDLTTSVVWSSLEPSVATIGSAGDVTGRTLGATRLFHSLAGVRGDTLRVQVVPAQVESLAVWPASLRLPPGARVPLAARAYWDNGTSADVTLLASWAASDSAVAHVDTLGRLQATSNGTCSVLASFGGKVSRPASVTVDIAALEALAIVPADTTLQLGSTLAYRATGTTGTWVFDLSSTVAWGVADTMVARIASGGSLTTRAVGSTTVEAGDGAIVAPSAQLVVSPPQITRLDVLPSSSTLRLGSTKAMTARATLSDGSTQDVTAVATWASDAPAIVHVDVQGVARALGLGTAHLTATYAGNVSPPATLSVLPAVVLDPIATGSEIAPPGATDRLLASWRFTNRYTDVRRMTALRVRARGPATSLRLRLDDGDGAFEPAADRLLATGVLSNGTWTATGLALDLPVGSPQTLFLSGDISLLQAAQGDSLDASIQDAGDIFWSVPTALGASAAFPIDSPGAVRVEGMVLAQITFQPTPADSVLAGTAGHVLLELQSPDDGGKPDTLQSLAVLQAGSAQDADISRLRLQTGPAPWTDTAPLVPTGGGRWAASGLHVPVPVGGAPLRVVADVAPAAAAGRTLRLRLPTAALVHASTRTGPIDAAWTNPSVRGIQGLHALTAQAVQVARGESVRREARRVPVLGIDLAAAGAVADTLVSLRLRNLTSGNSAAPPDPNLEIEAAELWLDTDGNGALGTSDPLLETLDPGNGTTLDFGVSRALGVPLGTTAPVHLLVTLTPDSSQVRDAERLAVQLATGSDLVTRGRLAASLFGLVQTEEPPVTDGQSASGYAVRAQSARIVAAVSPETVVLDLAIPSNGFENDVLQALRIENDGTASGPETGTLRLRRDDGDGTFGPADSLVAKLTATGDRTWQASGLAVPLPSGAPGRFFITLQPGLASVSGRTFEARVPQGGVTVASGNDGPVDRELRGGGPIVFTVADQVLWVAGVAGSHAVRPDVRRQPVLVLETLNGYTSSRSLNALTVALRGSATERDYDTWALYSDDNANGLIDDTETALAVSPSTGGYVRFANFVWTLVPLRQQRLLVTYSLALPEVRDGVAVDAAVENGEAFEYASNEGPTLTTAQFEMNSPGEDTVDGCVRRQLTEAVVASLTLGGTERDVLALDLTLPSNGYSADELQALEVEFVPHPATVLFGEDVESLRLWAETDGGDPRQATFDPQSDFLLGVATSGPPVRFGGLALPIPAGGRRIYVTADIASAPADGRLLQLRVPLNGITFASGNDGPIDATIDGSATFPTSSSALLASVTAAPREASVGQFVDVAVEVRNRGGSPFDSVVVRSLDVLPSRPGSLVSGPYPPYVTLAPGATDTLAYRFRFDVPGTVRFQVAAAVKSDSLEAPIATSPPVAVSRLPSALRLETLSSLPGTVQRGQAGVVPIVWRLAHADDDSLAAPIAVRALEFRVETGAGTAQSARAVFDHLEAREAGHVLATLAPPPDSSRIRLDLEPPIVLRAGEERDVSLVASIAPAATATSVRLRLPDTSVVAAADANGGAAVPLQASLPWATLAAAVRSEATTAELTVARTLPVTANRGQIGVSAGSVQVALAGNPGEMEARLERIVLAAGALDGTTLDPGRFMARFRVTNGITTLLDTAEVDTTDGKLVLALTIPQSLTSGAPQTLDLAFDLRPDAPLESLTLGLETADVVDAVRGTTVPVVAALPDSLPLALGPLTVQQPSGEANVTVTSQTPTSATAGARSLPVAALHVEHWAAAGSAAIEIRALTLRVVDGTGALVAPRRMLDAMRVRRAGVVAGSSTALPDVAVPVQIALSPALRLDPGEALDLAVEADLSPAPASAWLRFGLETEALEIHDANDPELVVSANGTLPFASDLVHVVTRAPAVALGVTQDPPANAARGAQAVTVLGLRLQHPGGDGQAPIAPAAFTILLRDVRGAPLAARAIATAARLVAPDTVLQASLASDSLRFDLTGLSRLEPRAAGDFSLVLDVAPVPGAEDVRFGIDAGSVAASSDGTPVAIEAASGTSLPYLSPSLHLAAVSLEQSFANYPNPFAAGRETTRITFNLTGDARVTVDIYDLAGSRVVRLLDRAPLTAGLHDTLLWDGRNGDGESVRNGTYLLRLVAEGPGGGKVLRKLAVLR